MADDWLVVTDEISARLSYPCERDYGRGELYDVCGEPYQGHGHILIQAPEGVGRIPFSCLSQKGIEEILGYMVLRYDQEVYNEVAKVLLAQDADARSLPIALTREEQDVLSSMGRLEKASDINFVDDWS